MRIGYIRGIVNCQYELAEPYTKQHLYKQVEMLYKQVIDIQKQYLGNQHSDMVDSLNNLANLYHIQGMYALAEPLHRKVLDISQIIFGEQHLNTATSIDGLAKLYYDQGAYDLAKPLYLQALAIRRSMVNDQHLDIGSSLNNLANLYHVQSAYDQAEPLYEEALSITRTKWGEQHPDTANNLCNLGLLYLDKGAYGQAKPLLEDALGVAQSTLGRQHPETATKLENLAHWYLDQRFYDQAEPLLLDALEITRTTLGDQHPETAIRLHSLSILDAILNRPDTAIQRMTEVQAVDDHQLQQLFISGSERRKLAYLQRAQFKLHQFISLIHQYRADDPLAIQQALNLILRRKGLVAESMSIQHTILSRDKHSELKPKLDQLMTPWEKIILKPLNRSSIEGLDKHQTQQAAWEQQQEVLEYELAQAIPETSLEHLWHSENYQAIALQLPDKATLVEFFRLDRYNFDAKLAVGESRWQSPHYLAFVLSDDPESALRMIDLGEAEPIDQLIADLRFQVTHDQEEIRGNPTRIRQDTQVTTRKATAQALYQLVFQPLIDAIGEATTVLLAPDSELNRLPFEILIDEHGMYLGKRYNNLHYLETGRDLLRQAEALNRFGSSAVIMADPDYNCCVAQPPTPDVSDKISNGSSTRGLRASETRFNRLSGTRLEGAVIGQRVGQKPILGDQATVDCLQQQQAPDLLHIATHGFFLDKLTPLESAHHRADSILEGRMNDLAQLNNPLLRSGLALAGANRWLNTETDAMGIVTAKAITDLNLNGTQLVVLSACETGLGEMVTGEGVFGLRRAFTIAGAQTLVVSLWKVSDLATALLMDYFYDNLLNEAKKMGRADALQAAKDTLRQLTVKQLKNSGWLDFQLVQDLAASDASFKKQLDHINNCSDNYCPYDSPYFWGAFICLGDPRPLNFEHQASVTKDG